MASADLKRTVRRLAAEFPPARWAVRGAAHLFAPRYPVGAVGVVFDREGRVLLVEHAFRTDFPWGLPGGWVERGEEPAATVRRELREELGLEIDVRELVHCGVIDRVRTSTHPVHLGLAYRCDLTAGSCHLSQEVLGFEWVDPSAATHTLAPFQRRAITSAAAARTGRSSATPPTPRA